MPRASPVEPDVNVMRRDRPPPAETRRRSTGTPSPLANQTPASGAVVNRQE
jgi:hypothetical protein